MVSPSAELSMHFVNSANGLGNRLAQYYTDNPNYKLLDAREGTIEDEKRFHQLYKEYSLNNSEWCINKRLVYDLWIDYYKESIAKDNYWLPRASFTKYDTSATLWKNGSLKAAMDAALVGIDAINQNKDIKAYESYLYEAMQKD